MAIKQLSVYLENRPGTLAETIRNISDAGISIRALSLADTAEFGILRLITDDTSKTEQLLAAKTNVKQTDVLAVKMEDQPGGLRSILDILEKANVNIEYMYAFAAPYQNAYAVFRVDDCSSAEEHLLNNGIESLKEGDIQAILTVK